MDKRILQTYSVWAKENLEKQVEVSLKTLGINGDNDIKNAKKVGDYTVIDGDSNSYPAELLKKRNNIVNLVTEKGYKNVIEEFAYTWFNRFMALRFMEVHDYLPHGFRVLSNRSGAVEPEILKNLNLVKDELRLDMAVCANMKEQGKTEELYRYVLLRQCNALADILPVLFTRENDYLELLLPKSLLIGETVLTRLIEIPEENFLNDVQIIGWLYQYYNSAKKDNVFADLKKNIKISKENIPAATQLFTPDWIVRYMVENSLGRLWLEGHPNDELKANWKYYLEEAEQEPEVQKRLEEIRKEYAAIKPEDIKVIDPCMGSGHILVYMFDVLVQIYEAYGYNVREAAGLILQNNLYGLDIDDRAAQLAYFAVMMKARQYDRRIFSRGIQPHVYAIVESNGISRDVIEYFEDGRTDLKVALETILTELHDAKEYGSILNVTQVDFAALYARLGEIQDNISMFTLPAQTELRPLIEVAEAMTRKYHVVVTNPPYMGNGGMSDKLSEFVKRNYPDTKSDLSTVFMEKNLSLCDPLGFIGMINIPVWMFLSSFEKLRYSITKCNTYINMLHFGRGVFGSDFGTTSFVIAKNRIARYQATYQKLFERQGAVDSLNIKEKWFFERKGLYLENQENYLDIPGVPVAYSLGKKLLKAFMSKKLVSTVSDVKQGLATGDNNRFLRLWWEVNNSQICFDAHSAEESAFSKCKWFPYNKGGAYRKWYGNIDYVVNWENDGLEIKNIRDKNGKLRSRPQNLQYFFREAITWSKVTIGGFSVRYVPYGAVFDVAGCSLFPRTNLQILLANLNSCVQTHILSVFSQSVNYEVGQIAALPIVEDCTQSPRICELSNICIVSSKGDWDSFETSWDFKRHPLI